eukprot:2392651-Pyramimonas_sp.AAC.1
MKAFRPAGSSGGSMVGRRRPGASAPTTDCEAGCTVRKEGYIHRGVHMDRRMGAHPRVSTRVVCSRDMDCRLVVCG